MQVAENFAAERPISLRAEGNAPYQVNEVVYPPGLSIRFQHHDAYLCFVLQGLLSVTNLRRSVNYPSAELIFFPSGQDHVVRVVQPTRCLIVRVGQEMMRRFPAELDNRCESSVMPGWEAFWLAKRLYAEYLRQGRYAQPGRKPASGPLLTEAILLQILVLVARAQRRRRTVRQPSWLDRVRAIIDAEFLTMDCRLDQLGALAGVHPVHLAREFRRQYGITTGQYIRRLRFEHACDLISRTGLSLAEIALTCRFVDQSHFSNQFKKLSGLTPSEYRECSAREPIDLQPAVYHEKLGQDAHVGVGV